MARFGYISECDGAEAPEASASFAPPPADAAAFPVWLPQPLRGGGRNLRGFFDAATVRELRQAAASGAALNAVAPISRAAAAPAERRPSLALPLLLIGGLWLSNALR